jgi:Tol biopolymer transport system component
MMPLLLILEIDSADDGNQTMLTGNPTNASEPCWSPDGLKLAFQSNRDGKNEIYVMPLR